MGLATVAACDIAHMTIRRPNLEVAKLQQQSINLLTKRIANYDTQANYFTILIVIVFISSISEIFMNVRFPLRDLEV
jgi:hypothetical protein